MVWLFRMTLSGRCTSCVSCDLFMENYNITETAYTRQRVHRWNNEEQTPLGIEGCDISKGRLLKQRRTHNTVGSREGPCAQ